MVIDENLPLGIIANTAAVMGVTLGKQIPEIVGCDVSDKTGNNLMGIIKLSVPNLKGTSAFIKELRKRLCQPDFNDLIVVDLDFFY